MKTVAEFEEKYKHMLQLHYGVSCNDGWIPLLDRLFSMIDHYVTGKKKHHKIDIEFTATTIKEKFGGLRIYFDGGDEYIGGLISFAEAHSYDICENCSTNQDIGRTNGWVRSLCRSCGNDPAITKPENKWFSKEELDAIRKEQANKFGKTPTDFTLYGKDEK